MRTRKIHSKSCKLEAVRLLASNELSAADLARQLGVKRNQLYKW